MRVESERLVLYPNSDDEMRSMIEAEKDLGMKQAYSEMLQGCLEHPESRIWNAVWNMVLKEDMKTVVGDFAFKGLGNDGMIEIGYGLKEEYQHNGYMTEAVRAISKWALTQEGVKRVEAETNPQNESSQRVLTRVGYRATGEWGEEGPRFVYQEE